MSGSGPSRRVGRYELREPLGAGAFGSVFRAWDPEQQRDVAIKVLTAPDAKALARFEQEARAISRLDHAGIVPLLDRGSEPRPWLVMELVAGQTLEDLVRAEHPLALPRGLDLVRDIACAIQYAHDHGVLHRDIKPANVLVEAGDRIRVVDFGLARLSDGARLTKTGATIGTPYFVSPEQAAGKGLIDARSDVYSLGAVLYYVLTNRLPLEVSSEAELWTALFRRIPDPPSRYRPELPAAVDAICARALAKSPADRYPTAGDLADALDEAALLLDAPAPKRSRVGPALLVGALATLLGGGALAWRATHEPPPAPAVAEAPTPTPTPPSLPEPAPTATPSSTPSGPAPSKLEVALTTPGQVQLVALDGQRPTRITIPSPGEREVPAGRWRARALAPGHLTMSKTIELQPGGKERLSGELQARERWRVELDPKIGEPVRVFPWEVSGQPFVFVLTPTHLAAIDGPGRPRWSVPLEHGFGGEVTGTGGERTGLVTTTTRGGVARLSARGKARWVDALTGAKHLFALQRGPEGAVVVTYPERDLVRCLDLKRGQELWRRSLERPGAPGLQRVDGKWSVLIEGRRELLCYVADELAWSAQLPPSDPGADAVLVVDPDRRSELLVTRGPKTVRLSGGQARRVIQTLDGRITHRLGAQLLGVDGEAVFSLEPRWRVPLGGRVESLQLVRFGPQTAHVLARVGETLTCLTPAGERAWTERVPGLLDARLLDTDQDGFQDLLLSDRQGRVRCWSGLGSPLIVDTARSVEQAGVVGFDQHLSTAGPWLTLSGAQLSVIDPQRRLNRRLPGTRWRSRPTWDAARSRLVFVEHDTGRVLGWDTQNPLEELVKHPGALSATPVGDLTIVGGVNEVTVFRGEASLQRWSHPGRVDVPALAYDSDGDRRSDRVLVFGDGGLGQLVELEGQTRSFPVPGPVRFDALPVPGGTGRRFDLVVATQAGRLVRYRVEPNGVRVVGDQQLDRIPAAQPALVRTQHGSLVIVPCWGGWLYAVPVTLKGMVWASRWDDSIPIGGVTVLDMDRNGRPEVAQAWFREPGDGRRGTRTIVRVHDAVSGQLMLSLPAGEGPAATPAGVRARLTAVGERIRVWSRWKRVPVQAHANEDMRACLIAGASRAVQAIARSRETQSLETQVSVAIAAAQLGDPAPLAAVRKGRERAVDRAVDWLAARAYERAGRRAAKRILRLVGKRPAAEVVKLQEVESALRVGSPVGVEFTRQPPLRQGCEVRVTPSSLRTVDGEPALVLPPRGRIRLSLPAGLRLTISLFLDHRALPVSGIRGDALLTVFVDGKRRFKDVPVPWRRFERQGIDLGTFEPGSHTVEVHVQPGAASAWALRSIQLVPIRWKKRQ